MAGVIFELGCDLHNDKKVTVLKVVDKTQLQPRKIYPDTLKSLCKDIDPLIIKSLIDQEAAFNGVASSFSLQTLPLNKIHLRNKGAKVLLTKLALTGTLYFNGQKLLVDPLSLVHLIYEASEEPSGEILVEGKLSINGKEIPTNKCHFFPSEFPLVVSSGLLRFLSEEIEWKWIELVHPTSAKLTDKKKEKFLDQFEDGEYPDAPKLVWKGKKSSSIQEEEIQPIPFLKLKDRMGASADLWMDYGGKGCVSYYDLRKQNWRISSSEKIWEDELLLTSFQKKFVGDAPYFCPLDKVSKSLTYLLDQGWVILDYQGKRVVRQGSLSTVTFEELAKEFIVSGKVKYEEHEVSLQDVLGAFNRKTSFIDISKDTVGLLDSGPIEEELQDLISEEITAKGIKVRKENFALMESFFSRQEKAASLFKPTQLHDMDLYKGIKEVQLPDAFKGALRPYQMQGVARMHFWLINQFHGLICDEMGLGKTVQVIAFLASQLNKKTHLIVVPKSLIFNWKNELKKFLPSADVYVYSGADRDEKKLKEHTIVITSYPIVRLDIEAFKKVPFEIIIIDEAQTIKNYSSQVAQAIYQLEGSLKIALTGTPVENKMEDLWSIFHFLMPQILGSLSEFSSTVALSASDSRYLARIKKKVSPFFLRRTKSEVAKELPEKIEQVVFVDMNDEQRSIYDEFVAKNKSGILKKVTEEGLKSHHMEVLEAILRLRQVCCHPVLAVNSLDRENVDLSGKLSQVLEDLEEIVKEGKKVLVYSQFTEMLKLIRCHIEKSGYRFEYLDGQTKDREEKVNSFQNNPEVSIFLISLKAGGVGLNLTAADYVFIFDPWWNEAVERQAIDRAHRLGRKDPIIARRYVTALSIEEKIMRIKESKNSLAGGVLSDELAFSSLDESTILSLLN